MPVPAGTDRARCPDTSTPMYVFTVPRRGPEPGAEVEQNWYHIVSHPGVLDALDQDLAAGAKFIRTQIDHPSTSSDDITVFGTHVCAMLQCMMDESKRDGLLTREFLDALWCLILDPRRYHMFDVDSEDVVIDPFPVVCVSGNSRMMQH